MQFSLLYFSEKFIFKKLCQTDLIFFSEGFIKLVHQENVIGIYLDFKEDILKNFLRPLCVTQRDVGWINRRVNVNS